MQFHFLQESYAQLNLQKTKNKKKHAYAHISNIRRQ